MKKGSQAWTNYGDRPNFNLLVNYSFCFRDNVYDSVKCRFRMDMIQNPNGPGVLDMICEASQLDSTSLQEIRFKRHHFNYVLMAYIRGCLQESWYKKNIDSDFKFGKLFMSRVVNLEFEIKCLQRYQEIVEHIIKKLERTTTL